MQFCFNIKVIDITIQRMLENPDFYSPLLTPLLEQYKGLYRFHGMCNLIAHIISFHCCLAQFCENKTKNMVLIFFW